MSVQDEYDYLEANEEADIHNYLRPQFQEELKLPISGFNTEDNTAIDFDNELDSSNLYNYYMDPL